MAQYDLLLTQNTAGAGTEYAEKYVNVAKGGLLSSDASGVPTVLAAGTNNYMLVRDDAETTGLKWIVQSGGHTQNTDTGTTGNTFTIDSDSVTGKIILDVALGATDNSLTLTNTALDGDRVITFPNSTGTVALTTDTHTQHTDTGTTSTYFDVDSGGTGVRLKNSTGELQLRNLGDSAYADLRVKDLTVEGTTTTINSTTLTVDDKNIELGSVGSPTDTTADGGGITLKGTSDKTIIWDNANDNWTLNQNVNIPTGTVYKINNSEVLSATQVLGVTLGTMASATATDYVAKALFDAQTILAATSDDTPAALTVAEQTIVGRITSGNIDALTSDEVMGVLWQSAPATSTSTGTANDIAFDTNYFYVCTATDVWKRAPIATTWT